MAQQMDTVDTPVATPEPQAPPPVLQPTDPKERHEWRLKGPQGPPTETPAADPAIVTEKPKSGKKLSLAEREKQVDDRIAEGQARLREKIRVQREIEAQLNERGVQPAPVETKPETKQSAWARLKAHPDAPKLDQFQNYEDFSAELSVFVAEKIADERDAAREQAAKHDQRTTAESTRLKQFTDRYAKADPETIALIEASDLKVPDDPRHPVTFAITASEMPAELMRYLVEHPEDHHRILSMPDPNAQYVAMQRIEARLEALREVAPSTPPAPRVADSRPAPTTAPDEPTILGRKPGSAVDELQEAWKRGDTRTARRLQLQKDRGSISR